MKKLIKLLKKSKNIALISHSNPDPDTIGSTIALKRILEKINKNVSIFVDAEKNLSYRFLDDYSSYIFDTNYDFSNFDKIIFVDVASKSMLGNFNKLLNTNIDTIKIDHHDSGEEYATCNFVKPYSACAIFIYEIAKKLKVKIDSKTATALYLAICGDTGIFKNSNTDNLTFKVCAELVDNGADMKKVYSEFFEKKSLQYLKLSSYALLNATTNNEFGFAIMSLSKLDYQKFNVSENESVGNLPHAYLNCGYKIAAILKEIDNEIRCSFRSKPEYDCSKIAETFGGGGHKNASGCSINDTLDNAKILIENAIKEYLQKFN